MAISVIALLISIGAVTAGRMLREARVEQNRAMMEGLLSANDEYKAVRQGPNISHTGPVANLSSTEQFVNACLQIKTCEAIMLSALNSGGPDAFARTFFDGNGNGQNSVYDRWGTEIEYRQQNNQMGVGPVNEEGVAVSNADLPRSRDPFFASAGPDQIWGNDDDITTVEQ